MEVVIPQRVEPVAALLSRAQQSRLLRLVLSDDERAPPTRRRSYPADDRGDNVIFRAIEYLLRRVQPQPIEMILVDPIAGIRQEELAHRAGIKAVEVDRLAPFIVVAISDVI